MRRIWIVLLASAVVLAIVVPAGAKKPDGPDKPSTGFKPLACQVDDAFQSADVTSGGITIPDVMADEETEAFTLDVEESGVFWVTRYHVDPGTPGPDGVLCVEVKLVDGTLSDLRVRWLGCEDCGLFRATGKDLRNFNSGEVFSAGVSVAEWIDLGEVTVDVMPKAKSDTANVTVKIGSGR